MDQSRIAREARFEVCQRPITSQFGLEKKKRILPSLRRGRECGIRAKASRIVE